MLDMIDMVDMIENEIANTTTSPSTMVRALVLLSSVPNYAEPVPQELQLDQQEIQLQFSFTHIGVTLKQDLDCTLILVRILLYLIMF